MKFKRSIVGAIVLLFALTACQEPQVLPTEPAPVAAESEPTAESASTDTAVPPPTNQPINEPTIIPPTLIPETAVTQPITEAITIEAADGLLLFATYTAPGGIAPFPGVLLLHMLGGNRQIWDDVGLTEALVADGYAVLALDMRGHGESGTERDWGMADDDLQRVWQYFVELENVDGERTAVIGASIGANMALRTGANEPTIKTVALLSPGLDYRRVTTDDAIVLYGDRPILIIASEEDNYAADSSRTLTELAQGEATLKMYNGAGHGTNMFGPEPDLTQLLLDWLNQHLRET